MTDLPTVEDIARQAVAALNSSADFVLASQWVDQRYQQLSNQFQFRHNRRVGEIVIPAPINTGTVTATRGSKVITGNAAAQAVWSNDIVGRFIRVARNWYEIEGFIDSEVRLVSDYAEDDASGASYDIVQRHTAVETDRQWVNSFVHGRLFRPLDPISLDRLNTEEPSRLLVGATGPSVVSEVGLDHDNRRIFEFYPYPNQSELIYYTYWERPRSLNLDDQIPTTVPDHVLREGVYIDIMRFEMATALRASLTNPSASQTAAFWRNESRAQETRWERLKRDAGFADRGLDDLSFVLQSVPTLRRQRDVVTAFDEFFARGDRP